MSGTHGVRYRAHASVWLAHGYSNGTSGAPAFGTYMPDSTTTGYNGYYAATPFSTLTPYSGDITITTAGTTITGLDISGQILVRAANVTISSCRVRGNSTLSSNSACIDCNSGSASNVLIQDCLLVPDYPSVWWDGVIGHDYTAQRCEVYSTVDGFGVYNSTNSNGPANVNISGNYVHDLSYFYPDINHYQNGTGDDHTHNDCVQIQGNSNITITGNNFQAFASATAGNGSTQDAYYPCVTGQVITYSPSAQIGPITNVLVQQNWLHGGSRGIVAIQAGWPASDIGSIINNQFGGDQHDTNVLQLDNTLTYDNISGNVNLLTGLPVTPVLVPPGTG